MLADQVCTITTQQRQRQPYGANVVSIGAVTSLGQSVAASAAAVRAGVSSFGDHPYLVDQEGERIVVAMISDLPMHEPIEQRLFRLVLRASRDAVQPLLETGWQKKPLLPIFIGFPDCRPGMSRGVAEQVVSRFADRLTSHFEIPIANAISVGHSAGLAALEACRRSMYEHGAEFGLVGGVDTYIDADTIEWLEENEMLHMPSNPWGLIPGEASGFCLLGTSRALGQVGGQSKLRLSRVASSNEANRIRTETVCTGEGLTRAIKGALEVLPESALVDDIICDLNGEPYRADEYSFAITRIADKFVDAVAFQNPADCWGDVGAASALLFMGLAATAFEKGYSRGPNTLIWTSSEGGMRTAALLSRDTD